MFHRQGSLTGESFPVEKFAAQGESAGRSASKLTNVNYPGTRRASRAARRQPWSWRPGQRRCLGGVAASLVFNGLTKGDWAGAFFSAIAVAVGVTPEMLPMIVAVCLSKGAPGCRTKRSPSSG